MARNTIVVEKSSGKSLIGCLASGTLVIAVIVGIVLAVRNHHQKKNEEMRVQWLAPWVKTIS